MRFYKKSNLIELNQGLQNEEHGEFRIYICPIGQHWKNNAQTWIIIQNSKFGTPNISNWCIFCTAHANVHIMIAIFL